MNPDLQAWLTVISGSTSRVAATSQVISYPVAETLALWRFSLGLKRACICPQVFSSKPFGSKSNSPLGNSDFHDLQAACTLAYGWHKLKDATARSPGRQLILMPSPLYNSTREMKSMRGTR